MKKQQYSIGVSLPVVNPDGRQGRTRRMGRWRALSLVLVHVLILLHVAHYLWRGSTLSPLEPSEATYTLREGALNAGAIFLVLAVLSTLIFGRFFCGWACHLVAYQDLARWIMLKMGIRPRPVRSRLLVFVPVFAVFWLYVYSPFIVPWKAGGGERHLSWELNTTDFWATFPGLTISIVTFAVCGFLIVYVLGSKGFCTYGCPYGALFYYTDKAARRRIRVTDACDGSGVCTTVCSSNVDVAGEVARYGMVVDAGCMKCMDCVSHCPNGALYYGLEPKTAGTDSKKRKKRKTKNPDAPEFSVGEEVVLGLGFVASFVIFYDLYRTVPFLLAVGLSSIATFLVLQFLRLMRGSEVRVQNLTLKAGNRMRLGGQVFAGGMVLVLLFLGHSAVMRWNGWRGVRAFDEAVAARATGDIGLAQRCAADSTLHFVRCERWGLFHTNGASWRRAQLLRWQGRPDEAVRYFQRELEAGARDPRIWAFLGAALSEAGRSEESRVAFGTLAAKRGIMPEQIVEVARVLGYERAYAAQAGLLREGLARFPDYAGLAGALCDFLVQCPDASFRDEDEALIFLEQSLANADQPDPALLARLAALYERRSRFAEAAEVARRAATIAESLGQKDLGADMTALSGWCEEQAEARRND